VAGNGTRGFSGDGGPAISAELNSPFGITFDNVGNLYIADSANNRVRKVACSRPPLIVPPPPVIGTPPLYHLPEKFPGTNPNPPDPALKKVVTPNVKK